MTPPTNTPALDVTVDHPAVTADLLSNTMVTATLHASGGFTGAVTLTAAVVDATGAPLAGWKVTLDKPSVTVSADGDTPVVATVAVPSMSALAGKVQITAVSGSTTKMIESDFTLNNQITIPVTTDGNATCTKTANTAITIAQGTKVEWVNMDTANRIIIHIQGGPNSPNGITGFAHEPNPGMTPATAAAAGGVYDQTGTSAGVITWYCHAPGTDTNRYTITTAQ